MPIEFRCTNCNRLLRTPDGSDGKQAKCPECGTLLTIPAASVSPPTGWTAAGPATPSDNPYQSPAAYTTPEENLTAIRRGFNPTKIDAGDVLSRTWQIFKDQWAMGLVVVLIVQAISLGLNFGSQIMVMALSDGGRDEEVVAVVTIISTIVGWLINMWLAIGQIHYFLKVARGEPAEVGDMFSIGRYLLRGMGASILVGIIVVIGFILCIIPGIILGLMFLPTLYLIVDQDLGVFDALGHAPQITKGNKLQLFLLSIVAFFVGMLGLLACCIGILPASVYINIMFAVAYLAMTGQSTADQLATKYS